MTEEEAKKKWCPFARSQPLANDPDSSYNRYDDGRETEPAFPFSSHCIASRCMAWREERPAETRMQQFYGEEAKSITIPAEGHCGLAGKP